MKTPAFTARLVFLSTLIALSGCQTIKMPKLDVVKSPEFREDAANIPKSYPRVIDAPIRPEDVRSGSQWDKDAKALQRLRERTGKADPEPALTQGEIEAQFEALKSKAQSYKFDDPDGGIDTEFPTVDVRPRQR